jgi:hypothetical protein
MVQWPGELHWFSSRRICESADFFIAVIVYLNTLFGRVTNIYHTAIFGWGQWCGLMIHIPNWTAALNTKIRKACLQLRGVATNGDRIDFCSDNVSVKDPWVEGWKRAGLWTSVLPREMELKCREWLAGQFRSWAHASIRAERHSNFPRGRMIKLTASSWV